MSENQPSVLVVDDDEMVRELYEGMLAKEDYEVAFAENGEDALAQIARHTPDAMVLDLSMPKMDGFGVLRSLSETKHQIKILVVTARHAPEDIEKAISLGASDYLAKPFDKKELLSRLSRLTR